jgi:hypothetical protein
MSRLDRAGRKAEVFKVLRYHYVKTGSWGLTTGEIAMRMGLKSSTYLKNLCKEMTSEYDEITMKTRNGFDVFQYRPYRQKSLFDRIPTMRVNGKIIETAYVVSSEQQ